MNKRAFLKTIAFVCGLYFFLEYVLPEKLGGDFDSDSVHSPALVQTPDGPAVFYIGQYNQQKSGLGRLVAAPDATNGWRRVPDEPVMQRSLFAPHEKGGMKQLAAVAGSDGIDLFYLGLDREQNATLCHATGDPSGLTWLRTGVVLFATNGVPRPTVSEPNGALSGELNYFAVERAGNQWAMLLVIKKMGTGPEVWAAEGESLAAMRLAQAPLIPFREYPDGVTAFDGHKADGEWIIDFALGTNLVRYTQQADGAFAQAPLEILAGLGTVTGLRLMPSSDQLLLATHKTDAGAARTAIVALPGPQGGPQPLTVKTVGRPARSTYLSGFIQTAGTYLQVIGSFAVFIALINLTLFHGKRIVQRHKGGTQSAVFFFFLIAMAVFTLIGKSEKMTGTGWQMGYDFMFEAILRPVGVAVFSMITFYMISAAYRSFRVRSVDAALLMVSACIVMIGQMPIGTWLGSFLPDSLNYLRLPWLAEKLLTVINACAYRGVLIGLAIGGFSIALRIWLGLDNSVYAGLEDEKK